MVGNVIDCSVVIPDKRPQGGLFAVSYSPPLQYNPSVLDGVAVSCAYLLNRADVTRISRLWRLAITIVLGQMVDNIN